MSSRKTTVRCGAKKIAKTVQQALKDGDEDAALKIISESGINPDTSVSKEPILYTAVECGLFKVVRYLLDKKANPNCCMVYNRDLMYQEESPLFACARKIPTETNDVHIRIAELLLQKGADPEEEGMSCQTALHLSALYGNVPMIELLLKYGAKVDTCDDQGETPLATACSDDHREAIELLLMHGAEINPIHFPSPVKEALFRKKNDLVKFLLAKGADPNHTDARGETLCMTACKAGNLEGAKILIQAGANIKAVDSKGYGVLHCVCMTPEEDPRPLLSYMKEQGADLYAKDDAGNTPLDVACVRASADAVAGLIGLDLDIQRCSRFHTPIDAMLMLPAAQQVNMMHVRRVTKLLVAAGFPLPHILRLEAIRRAYITVDEVQELVTWIKDQIQNPRPLADQCRLRIRAICGKHINSKIARLDTLPEKLRGYLRFEDLLQHDSLEKCLGCFSYMDECSCNPDDYDYDFDFDSDSSSDDN